MKWKGIVTDTTDVDDTEGVSVYQQNTRMLIEGELQRRHGLIATGLSKANGALLNLAGGSGFIVTGIDGQADGVPDTISAITGPTRKPPIIEQNFPGESWTLPIYGPYGGWSYFEAQNVLHNKCPGSVTIHVSGADTSPPAVAQIVRRGAALPDIVIDQRDLIINSQYTVAIPPAPNGYTTLAYIRLSGAAAIDSYSSESRSSPGCG